MAAKIKKGDKVVVIAGSDKGKTGEVLKLFPSENKAIVQDVNVAVKHKKPSTTSQGGIERKEAKIHLSNLACIDPKTQKPTRVGFKLVDGKKIRVAKASGEMLDSK